MKNQKLNNSVIYYIKILFKAYINVLHIFIINNFY
jgi:hypothetical protein